MNEEMKQRIMNQLELLTNPETYEAWWNSLSDDEKEQIYFKIWVLPNL